MFFLVDVKKKDIQILKFYSRLGLNSSKPSTKPSATSLIHFFQDKCSCPVKWCEKRRPFDLSLKTCGAPKVLQDGMGIER